MEAAPDVSGMKVLFVEMGVGYHQHGYYRGGDASLQGCDFFEFHSCFSKRVDSGC